MLKEGILVEVDNKKILIQGPGNRSSLYAWGGWTKVLAIVDKIR